MRQPVAIDLFCGLGGWTDGLLAENYRVIGFDIERHDYGDGKRYPAQLVLQDVLTLHGSQFKDVTLIVASPPCQEYSYMAMPWSRAKAIAAEYRNGRRDRKKLTALFDACFRIQREACEAARRHVPLIVENVRGAQPWVGRSRWNYGSYHLWGDVPALMPMTVKACKFNPDGTAHPPGSWFAIADSDNRGIQATKIPGFRFDGSGRSFQSAAVNRCKGEGFKSSGMNWSDRTKHGQDFTRVAGHQAIKNNGGSWTNPAESGTKQGGDWFNASQPSISRMYSSKSKARKAASALIAKIPFALAQYIAQVYKPQ